MRVITDQKRINECLDAHDFSKIFGKLDRYREHFKLFCYDKNEMIIPSPENRKYMFFLVDGKFSVYSVSEEGKQMLVRYCDSFISMGDMELLGFSEVAHSIEMNSQCTFLVLDMLLFREELLSDSTFMYYIARGLAEKLNYFGAMQFHDKTITARQRVISQIISVAGERLFYKENLRKTSQILSISYRHMHRILADLVDRSVLKRENNGYRILNIAALENIYFEDEQ